MHACTPIYTRAAPHKRERTVNIWYTHTRTHTHTERDFVHEDAGSMVDFGAPGRVAQHQAACTNTHTHAKRENEEIGHTRVEQ